MPKPGLQSGVTKVICHSATPSRQAAGHCRGWFRGGCASAQTTSRHSFLSPGDHLKPSNCPLRPCPPTAWRQGFHGTSHAISTGSRATLGLVLLPAHRRPTPVRHSSQRLRRPPAAVKLSLATFETRATGGGADGACAPFALSFPPVDASIDVTT